jgi:hypothetical protein
VTLVVVAARSISTGSGGQALMFRSAKGNLSGPSDSSSFYLLGPLAPTHWSENLVLKRIP